MYNIETYTNKLKMIDATYLQVTAPTKNQRTFEPRGFEPGTSQRTSEPTTLQSRCVSRNDNACACAKGRLTLSSAAQNTPWLYLYQCCVSARDKFVLRLCTALLEHISLSLSFSLSL